MDSFSVILLILKKPRREQLASGDDCVSTNKIN